MSIQGETVGTSRVLRSARWMMRLALPCALAGCCLFFLAGCGADVGDVDRATSAAVKGSSVNTSEQDSDSAADTIRQAAVAQNTADIECASASVRQAIEQVTAPYGQAVSVTYLPVGTPAGIVSVNGSTQHASASMIKLVVLATLFDKVAAGEIDLAAQVEVKVSDIVSGTGTVQDDGPGTYELRELARRMIADSDNTATNVIVDLIGMDAVNEEASKLGLTGTAMARKMMDVVAADQGMRNRMTSDDAATVLNLIATGKLVNEQMSELAMSFLLQQTINAGITDAIPAGVQVAHKTGELNQAEHDGGVVLAAHPYVLVVMTEGIDNYLGVSVIADVSRAVYVATEAREWSRPTPRHRASKMRLTQRVVPSTPLTTTSPACSLRPTTAMTVALITAGRTKCLVIRGIRAERQCPPNPRNLALARKPAARRAVVRRAAPRLSPAPAALRVARVPVKLGARVRAPVRKAWAAPGRPAAPAGRAVPRLRTLVRATLVRPAAAKAVPGRPEGLPPTPPKASRFAEAADALWQTRCVQVGALEALFCALPAGIGRLMRYHTVLFRACV